MAPAFMGFVVMLLCINDISAATTVIPSNSTSMSSTLVTTSTTRLTRDCEFILLDNKIRDSLSETLEAGAKLIKFHMKFKGYPDDILSRDGGNIFRPSVWMRSTNRQGMSLLMLDDNFEVLSLSMLGVGVVNMDVELDERPYGCMNALTSGQRVNKTRELLLNDFKIPGPGEKTGSLDTNERICNLQIKTSTDTASFVYHCCHIDPDGNEICEDVERDVWINVLLVCIIVIKVLVVLFSPSFIPETFYRKKFTEMDYVYNIPNGKKKKIRIVKTVYPSSYTSQNPAIKLQKLEDLDNFKESLSNLCPERVHDLELDSIQFFAKCRKLLPENYVPVSIVNMIYENVFRCKMRSIPVLKPCCDTGVCGILDVGCKVLTWYKCLRIFAKLVLVLLLAIPWILRLIVYFTYELVAAEEKRTAAERYNTSMAFSGSFTLYLTPLHGLFVATYIIVMIDSFAYGLLGKTMKNRFKFVLRKCLRDMRERSRLGAYGWAVRLCLLQFKRLGLIGFLLAPLLWIFLTPFVLPILAFYTFPALNLSVRLIIHLFIFLCPNNLSTKMHGLKEKMKIREAEEEFQGKENLSKKEVCMQLIIIVMCLTSFWSLTFLLMECLSFFVEVGVYTLMGIIVNAKTTLQYVTLLFLIGMYANSSFGGVHKMYLDYHKVIRGLLLGMKHKEMKATARQDESVQKNTVFRVPSSKAVDATSGIDIEVKDDILRWNTMGLLVFLSNVDQPFTPAKFFFETIKMEYCGCPGKLWQNTLMAFYNFMKIMVFLFFVVVVVLAFGNQFSTTNQMLATLAGGFVPFVFRNFFMKGAASFTVDTDSVQFVTEFDKAIANYTQKWPIADITPSSIAESGLGTEAEPGVEETEVTTNLSNNQNDNGDVQPLMESGSTLNDVRVNIDVDPVETENDTKVDLIIDIARFDNLNRRLGTEGSSVNIGSMSMLGHGSSSLSRTHPQNERLVDA